MALVNRISRLFRADFHAVLDQIEEPDLLLRQAIREMQDDMAQDEQQMKRLQVEQQQAERQLVDIGQSLQQIEEELDICFAAGKEELARQTVRRKLEQQQRQQRLIQHQDSRKQQIDELQQCLSQHRRQLQTMQEKAECLLETAVTADHVHYESTETGVQEREVEVAFLKEQQRRAS